MGTTDKIMDKIKEVAGNKIQGSLKGILPDSSEEGGFGSLLGGDGKGENVDLFSKEKNKK